MLGVPRDADQAAIKDAFRRLALRYHPDRCKEPGAEERFKEIAEAYAVLSDPARRREYDAAGFAGVAGVAPEDLFRGIDFEDLLGGLGFDLGESLFDRFFGRRRPGPPRGENVEVTVEVPLARVLSGGPETVRVARPETCPTCRGTRARPGTSPRDCTACRGTGQHVTRRREGGTLLQRITTCKVCGGRGQVIDQPCPDCAGRGSVEREESVTVTIPPGVADGTSLRIPGRGLPSARPGGVPGDLFVVVRTAHDPRFERDGADLWRTETITVADAVLGTGLQVPTLEGTATVTVPPGTQPDTVLRLKGKGLPRLGERRRGDFYVRLRVRVPERLGPEERRLWQRLRALGACEAAGKP